MTGRILLKTALFFLIWMALSGKFNFLHLTIGLGLSLGIAWLNTWPLTGDKMRVSWVGVLTYVPWLFSRILASSIHMVRLILDPKLPIDPQLFGHQTSLPHHAAVVLLGNSITLTPGTITVEVSPNELTVHSIDPASSNDLLSGTLEKKVATVFPSQPRMKA
ncbi:MAG: Na+/H+ antiporter subunit E [Nitrospirota bacterium]|nr:MAG: Na+/H+ antiporter subunit E [Nitrospirota bacterium]